MTCTLWGQVASPYATLQIRQSQAREGGATLVKATLQFQTLCMSDITKNNHAVLRHTKSKQKLRTDLFFLLYLLLLAETIPGTMRNTFVYHKLSELYSSE